jgi:SAM-dependent methyltransferase
MSELEPAHGQESKGIDSTDANEFKAALRELAEQQITPETESKPTIYLEVGIGAFSSAVRTNREFRGNDKYVGVELNTISYAGLANFEHAKRSIEKAGKSDQNIEFIQADGTALPFSDASVHEVLMNDVLNSDLTDQNYGIQYDHEKTQALIEALIKEAHRVLASDGKFIVFHEDTIDSVKTRVMEAIKQGGFQIDGVVDSGLVTDADGFSVQNPEYQALEDIYPNSEPSGQYIIARKTVGEEPATANSKRRWFKRKKSQ